MCSLSYEFRIDFTQPFDRNGNTLAAAADDSVLTEAAAKVAAGEKDRTAAAAAADTGFFPMMQGSSGDDRLQRRRTVSRHGGLRCIDSTADDAAVTGTVSTNRIRHGVSLLEITSVFSYYSTNKKRPCSGDCCMAWYILHGLYRDKATR